MQTLVACHVGNDVKFFKKGMFYKGFIFLQDGIPFLTLNGRTFPLNNLFDVSWHGIRGINRIIKVSLTSNVIYIFVLSSFSSRKLFFIDSKQTRQLYKILKSYATLA